MSLKTDTVKKRGAMPENQGKQCTQNEISRDLRHDYQIEDIKYNFHESLQKENYIEG